MEKAVSFIASIITILGFVLAITQISEFGVYEFNASTDVSPLLGSLLFALISVMILAVCFGYGFGYLIAAFEKRLGRIALVLSTPILGLLSAFQTGVVTLVVSRIFDISSMLTFVFVVSFFISAAFELMFIFKHFEKIFHSGEPIKPDEMPKFSVSSSAASHVFFCIGILVFLSDSKLPLNDGAWVGAWIGVFFGGAISYLAGMGLFELLKESRKY